MAGTCRSTRSSLGFLRSVLAMSAKHCSLLPRHCVNGSCLFEPPREVSCG